MRGLAAMDGPGKMSFEAFSYNHGCNKEGADAFYTPRASASASGGAKQLRKSFAR